MDIQALDKAFIAPTYNRAPVTFVRGEGCYLFDDAGNRYIDMGSGIAVNALGYGDAEWVAAVSHQAAQLAHASNLYYTAPQAELAELLCARSGLKRVFFGNSGAEANECAIKVARRYSAQKHGENVRPVIVTLENSFHGRTLATLAATGQEVFHHDFGPFPEGFRHVPANDVAALKQALDAPDVCALMIEIVQGEGGVNVLTPEYVQAARELTEARDQLLLIDEVQTGNGRTGKWFSYQHFGILPDVATTAKGLAGGLPMGACMLGEKAQDALTAGTHGSTFGGNPVCAAAALCVQRKLTPELLQEVSEKGEQLRTELEQIEGVTVSGMGLMLGVESAKPAAELSRELLSRGLITLTAKTKLRLVPPLTLSQTALNEAITILKEALRP